MSNIGDLIQRDVKDRPAHVRFERVAVEDPVATRAAGHYVARDIDYVTVTPVGGGGNGVKWKIPQWRDNLAREVQNGRIPPQWVDTYEDMYRRWQAGQEMPLNGAPIRGWMVISPAQQETLIARGVLTVEDLASLNAEGVQRVGMGGMELKNKAKMWLQAAKDTGPIVLKNAALEKELDLLKANNADLTQKVEQLMAAMRAQGDAPPASVPQDTGISAADILDDREELAVQYTAKFGKPPHHLMKRDTIERALRE